MNVERIKQLIERLGELGDRMDYPIDPIDKVDSLAVAGRDEPDLYLFDMNTYGDYYSMPDVKSSNPDWAIFAGDISAYANELFADGPKDFEEGGELERCKRQLGLTDNQAHSLLLPEFAGDRRAHEAIEALRRLADGISHKFLWDDENW